MIKVSDYIANYLSDVNIKHVFMLTGGAAMHLNDSLAKHQGLHVVFNHHEQACAMAAESYARLTNTIAVVNVTSGPGGLNALNGVFGAWTDSIPMLVLSGQVRLDTTVRSSGLALRQLGDQECDIIKSVEPMTKYAVMVTDPRSIKYHLQKAIHFASKGRQGPVWLDIPINVQAALVDEDLLSPYAAISTDIQSPPLLSLDLVKQVLERIRHAAHPVVLVGSGVRLSGAHQDFLNLVDQLKIPVVTAFNAHDAIHDSHIYYSGRAGTVGDRAGNFSVQNADVLLVLGCRLNIRQISYDWQNFSRGSYKIAVDIDELELQKKTVHIDLPVHADLADFIGTMLHLIEKHPLYENRHWIDWCRERQKKYPVVLAEYWKRTDTVNPYCFIDALSTQMPEGQIIVTANATACITAFQAMKIKKGQRLYSNSGSASMGYDLPAAIGACVGSGKKKIVCLAGDGSLQQNIQELATIRCHQFPIKIFVLNNNGYHSIRQTQNHYFPKSQTGVCPDSGLFFPNLEKLTQAYEISYVVCRTHSDLEICIKTTLEGDYPTLCEVMITTEQPFSPKLSSKLLSDGRMISSPLEDLAPFLSREELRENMIIDLISEE